MPRRRGTERCGGDFLRRMQTREQPSASQPTVWEQRAARWQSVMVALIRVIGLAMMYEEIYQ